jgi:iron complex transport system substrate-binding protein
MKKKKMFQVCSLILAVALVTTIFVGCSRGRQAAAASGMQVIVDSLGRSVEIPKDIQRVVSLSVTNTEILCVLGVEDKIVGVCEWVKRGSGYGALIYQMHPELRGLPSPGGGPKPVNVEEVLALDPDIVLVSGVGTDWVDELENYGIPVVAARFEDIETSMQDLRIVAKCIGKEKEAEKIVSFLESKLDFIASKLKGLSNSERPGACYLNVRGGNYSVYGGNCYQDTQIKTAGGENIASGLTIGAHGELSLEQLLLSDPDVIITHHGTTAEDILSNPGFADISAVKNQGVYTLPEWGWDFGSLRDIFCIEWLATKLHPDRFADVDINAEANEFYNFLYGIDYAGPFLASTRSIVDMAGVTVTIPGQVHSAVAIYPMALQIIFAINGQKKLAGAAFASSETYNLMKQMDPSIADVTDLGHPNNVSIEPILALDPDVLFNSTTSGMNESLTQLGIPVVQIYVETPELIIQGTELIGTILDRKAEASDFGKYYQSKLDMIAGQLSSVSEEKKVRVYGAGFGKLKTAAGNWFQNCVIENAGGISFSRSLPSGGWQTVILEDLLAWNPDVIICGFDPEEIRNDRNWQSMPAVKNNRIYRMPEFLMAWNLPIPESILATTWTTSKLYPGIVDIDMVCEVKDFYSHFYQYEVSQQEIAEILGE